jgi:hypothetical protein
LVANLVQEQLKKEKTSEQEDGGGKTVRKKNVDCMDKLIMNVE